ncbi:caspase family protein [Methanosarcina mazei]|uniref:Peptidase C14 n=1 Tax=Methanosarcina mazei TaxID=2209 RepID=A0A0F8QZI3_METMZ|nr:caspase family protein [Methanosarcina mazei]MDY0388081.1 caspase family protein [Methanolobus sp.]KKF98410.1 peptidase C14 [Methanosarcina mazei]KKF99919.1 peptidase C14 [Methanosarcina mazei]KKG04153.1 peptidase C14 [Methanosarcina mazei]KKH40334.1 peptidase C14 [Methanosarcina mazei]
MRKALVIGINDYKGKDENQDASLEGCVNDAIYIASILEKNEDGSPNFDVKLITNPPNTTDIPTIRWLIEELFEASNDVALFYYAGHGLLKSTGGYIVTSDFRQYNEGISMQEILELATNSEARSKIIILDCCHSGSFATSNLGNPNVSNLCNELTVITASRHIESAAESDNGHGVFTSLLIDALQGGAADIRGHITAGSIYAYIDSALGAWAQRPIFKTNVSRFVPIRSINPKISLEKLRRITKYFPKPENEFKLDPSYEPTSEKAIAFKCAIFKDLQDFESEGLVKPVDEEHMYYAAMNSKSCKLTALGYHYWRLVKQNKL